VTGDVVSVVGKGGRRRLAYLDELTLEYIEKAGGEDHLIPAGTSAVRQRVMRLGARAGLPSVRPHSFRHAFASAWALETGDMLTLKELGGWQGDAMVRWYTRSAMQEVAVRKARAVGLTARLLDTRTPPP
jgi:integrase